MPLPDLTAAGNLPPGIHAASLREVQARFGDASPARQLQIGLLRQIIETSSEYRTIKRILLWGSFVTNKREPADFDYSMVVSIDHFRTEFRPEHRRFFVPFDARQFYGVDRSFLVIKDYPLEEYVDRLDFICRDRSQLPRGIVEISLRGEYVGEPE